MLHQGPLSLRLSVAQVVGQGGGEQKALLRHQADPRAELLEGQARDVIAIEKQLAGVHIHHPAQGPGEGGFAATNRSHYGHQLPGSHGKTHILQSWPWSPGVPNRQAAGHQGTLARPLGLHGLRRRHDQGFALEQILHPLQAHPTGLEGVEGEPQQGGGKHQPLHVEDQRHNVADAEPARFQLAAAQGQQQQQAHRRDPLQQGKQGAAGAGQVEGGIAVEAIAAGKGGLLGAFLAVDLDGANAGEVFLD